MYIFIFVLTEKLKMHTVSNLHFYSKEVSTFSCGFRSALHISICQENTDLSCLCAFINIIISCNGFSIMTSFCLDYQIAFP